MIEATEDGETEDNEWEVEEILGKRRNAVVSIDHDATTNYKYVLTF